MNKRQAKKYKTKEETNYFYNVRVFKVDSTKNKNYREYIATFKTFEEANDFVSHNIIDINETRFNIVEIHKLAYGMHHSCPVETFIYKFDRIMQMYFLIKRVKTNLR